VLKPLPGYTDRLAAMNGIINQGVVGLSGPAPKGAFSRDNRLPLRDTIAGLETSGETKAYPISALRHVRAVNDIVAGSPVLIVYQRDSDTTTAFLAVAGGKRLKFRAADTAADRLVDLETHSTWNAYGVCTVGRSKGARLKPLVLEPEFWFA
jgi:hypothetical protein